MSRARRTLGRTAFSAALALASCMFPPAPSSADFFDRIMPGRATYETFKGKFVESDAVKTASSAAVTDSATKGIGGEGHFVGSATWDGIPSPELHAYAETILNRLLAGWGGAHPKMRLWITANPGLEAESNSAGDLFVARGWFDDVESEDEIAAVLAHEVSHVLLGHFARDEEHERNRAAITGAASVAATAFTIGSLRMQGTGQSATLGIANQSRLNHQIRDAAMIKFAVAEISNVALNAPWAREQEEQADLLGVDLLYRAKYNVLAMRDALQRLAAYEKTSDTQLDALSKQFQDSFTKSLAEPGADASSIQQGLGGALTDAMWSVFGSVNDELTRSHPHTEARIESISKYIGREYEDDPGPAKKVAEFKKFMANKRVQAELGDHALSVQASAMTDAKDRAKRAQLAARGARAGASGSPFPLRVMAQTLTESGQGPKALVLYRRAADSPDASFGTVTMLAGVYADGGDFPKAHAMLDEAVRRFGSEEAVYPTLITVDLKQGDQKSADAIYKACLAVKNEGLSGECKAAHGDACNGGGLECMFKSSDKDIKQTGADVDK